MLLTLDLKHGSADLFAMGFYKKIFAALSLVFAAAFLNAANTQTTTRQSETVDLYKLRPYDEIAQMKLRTVWQAFRLNYTLTDDGGFEPAIPGADACPDNQEAQIAFLHFVREKSIEVETNEFIRCGDCNGTGKRYIREGDQLTSTALQHIPCGATGKLKAAITSRLIYTGPLPAKLPSKNQLRFKELSKRAEAGDLDAEIEKAKYLLAGRGTPKDPKQAIDILAKATVRKEARAALALGGFYERGEDGVEPNRPMSIALYMLGQQLGGGSVGLDNIYRVAPPKDVMLGFWYGRALMKELRIGKLETASLSASGVRRLAAAQFARSATGASRQDGDLQLQDGMALLAGDEDRKPNLAGAYAKFKAAAAFGQADALYCLGVFHENALVVARSRASAYVFYSLAATMAGEEYMKMARANLDTSCRTDANMQLIDQLMKEYRSGQLKGEQLLAVTELKDIGDPVAAAPVGPSSGVVGFPDIYDPATGLQLKPTFSGSGLVFTPQGHIFTNHHVVDKGKAFTVRMQGSGPLRKARLIAIDPAYDLAILQIEDWKGVSETGYPLPSLVVPGTAVVARIGDRVFTIGFPLTNDLGVEPKYSSGDISTVESKFFSGSMQITCPIQPGNSGGPLVLERGHVAGVVVGAMGPLYALNKYKGTLPQGVNFAINIIHLRALADRNGVIIPAPSERVVNPVQVIQSHTGLIMNYQ